jgi:hypothetical protein
VAKSADERGMKMKTPVASDRANGWRFFESNIVLGQQLKWFTDGIDCIAGCPWT